MSRRKTLADVLKLFGGSQREMARKLGYSQHVVWKWFDEGRPSIPGAYAIDRHTGGAIPFTDLRPDILKRSNTNVRKHYRRDRGEDARRPAARRKAVG